MESTVRLNMKGPHIFIVHWHMQTSNYVLLTLNNVEGYVNLY